MIIHQIHDLSDTTIVKLLEQGLSQVTESELIKNYHPDYKSENSNLFYILKHGRYKTGNYYVAEEDGQFVGSSGWNWYKDDIVLALTRSYILSKHRQRNIMGTYFLPRILDETTSYNRIWCTCNKYNKVIYEGFVRMANGKRAGLSNPWLNIYSKFVPIGLHSVNHTEQYVVEYRRDL
jgi:hypothetical protein